MRSTGHETPAVSSGATTATHFDVSPLTGRRPWASWRRFRAEAIAGAHGTDLAEHGWWRRFELPIGAALVVAMIAGLPAILLPIEGVTPFTVGVLLAWCVCSTVAGVFILWFGRRDFWGPRARARYRLTTFAGVNGLDYQPETDTGMRAAHVFNSRATRRHIDRIAGPGRFTVANYEETWDKGLGEPQGYETGYVVFTLRESYPHTLVSRPTRRLPKGLSHVDAVDGPAGTRLWCTKPDYPLLRTLLATGVVEHTLDIGRSTQIEVVGNELFVLHPGGFLPIDSPRLWQKIDHLIDALAPFLATSTTGPESKEIVPAAR